MFSTPPADLATLTAGSHVQIKNSFQPWKKSTGTNLHNRKKEIFSGNLWNNQSHNEGEIPLFSFLKGFSWLNKQKPSWAMFGFCNLASTQLTWMSIHQEPPPPFLQSKLHPWVNNVTAPDRHQTGWRGMRSYRTQECRLGTMALFVHLAKVRKQEWSLSHVWKWGDWLWQHVHRQTSAEGHACYCEWGNDNGSQSVSHLNFGLQEVR